MVLTGGRTEELLKEELNLRRDHPPGVHRLHEVQTLGNGGEATQPAEQNDVLYVLFASGKQLHRQEVLRRRDIDPERFTLVDRPCLWVGRRRAESLSPHR